MNWGWLWRHYKTRFIVSTRSRVRRIKDWYTILTMFQWCIYSVYAVKHTDDLITKMKRRVDIIKVLLLLRCVFLRLPHDVNRLQISPTVFIQGPRHKPLRQGHTLTVLKLPMLSYPQQTTYAGCYGNGARLRWALQQKVEASRGW